MSLFSRWLLLAPRGIPESSVKVIMLMTVWRLEQKYEGSSWGGPPGRKNTDHSLASDIEQQETRLTVRKTNIMVYPICSSVCSLSFVINWKLYTIGTFLPVYVLIHFSSYILFSDSHSSERNGISRPWGSFQPLVSPTFSLNDNEAHRHAGDRIRTLVCIYTRNFIIALIVNFSSSGSLVISFISTIFSVSRPFLQIKLLRY